MTSPPRRRRERQPSAPGAKLIAALASGLTTLAVIGLVFSALGLVLYISPGPSRADKSPITVVLRKGSGVAEIAGELQRAHVVANGPIFMALAEISGAAHRIKPGEYAFPVGGSIAKVLEKLKSGDVVRHKITIPEGASAAQARDILLRSDVLTGEAPEIEEGSILPETYEVLRGDSRASVVTRMSEAMDRTLGQLWDKRQPNLPVHSPQEAIILASIVEKETASDADRPKVAAVYINRLRQGMKLDADPTIIYGVTKGRPLGRGILASELAADTPYNTYLHTGLPPTAIANPSRASLAAVLDPPHTQDLYFVADGTGGAAFSATLEQHQRNVQRWREFEKARAQLRR